MRRKKSLLGRFLKAGFLCTAPLSIFVMLSPAISVAEEKTRNDFTLRVRIRGEVSVSVRDLTRYFHAVSIQKDTGTLGGLEESMKLRKGDEIRVKVREGLDIFIFEEPAIAIMNAPIFLEKEIRVASLLGEDLSGKQGTIKIKKGGLGLEITKGGAIVLMSHDENTLDQSIPLVFDDELIARTRRIIGVKPFRRRSFEVLDRWVSAGEEVRIRIPMADYNKEESQVAVGFWTDYLDSGLEEEAYLADVSGIEQEKVGGHVYIVKATVPFLSELNHVRPGWYCPYPPRIKMTVTSKLDKNNIVTEDFDLRVARRGWGFAGGVIFLVIVFLFIMHVTKEWSPFEQGTASDKNYRKRYKSDWLKRFLFSPLDFSMTPIGTYSISKTQALFWTFLVAFCCVYVYILKAAFLMIPGQILILLGLTGGTALASRINAVSKDPGVPKEIIEEVGDLVQQAGRIPRLRDMISIGGRTNVYKFQMVVFTLITGIIVFAELIKSFNFPEIPNTLIVLIGVSNTLYLGNEVSVDPLKEVRQKVEEYEKEEDGKKRAELKKQIKKALIDCYQTA